ncbi:MAG: GatB/YqeY domain-containing protein [Bdellovibrionia bacterium]
MSLKAKILDDIKSAMKERNQVKTDTLRFLNSAVKYREIEVRPAEIKDEDVVGVIKKLVKQRQESIEQFDKAGRKDLSDKERAELEVIQMYLPKAMDRADVEKIVAAVIVDLKATTVKDMGPVMKEVIVRTAGAADNKVVSELVRAKLQ